jgi:uncharacterized Fe-S cluster-containing MiaB family protein
LISNPTLGSNWTKNISPCFMCSNLIIVG